MTPDRIDTLLNGLADEAARVPLGRERYVDGMRYTPLRSLYEQAARLIRSWQGRHPAPPTLDDVMDAFIADYPNGHLMVRHDPLRTVGQWTATAYCWRGDGDSPAEAIERLREVVVSNTISVLPALPDGTEWTCSQLGTVWRPEDSGRAAWLRNGIVRMTLFGPPPPLSVVSPVPVTGDTSACDERLYVPVKA